MTKLENGKWVVDHESINTLSFNPFKELMDKVNNLYDGDINYDSIDIVSTLMLLNEEDERKLAILLRSEMLKTYKL